MPESVRSPAWKPALLALIASCYSCVAMADSAQLALGKQLFTHLAVPPCVVCHTLKDADSHGAVGPVLDEIKPDAERVLKALRNGLGVMPSFSGRLSEEQMQALAVYVSTVSATD